MKSDEISFLIEKKYGKPDNYFEYLIDQQKDIKISLLVYLPIPNEGINTSILITAGFASTGNLINNKNFEFVFELNGKLTDNGYKQMGMEIISQIYGDIPQSVNKTISPLSLSHCPDFRGVIVLNHGKHETSILENSNDIQMLELVPLYEEEVEVISMQPKDITNAIIFRSHKIDWTDLKRSKVKIMDEAVTGVWDYILKWYNLHSSMLLSQLKPGTDQKSILKLNKTLGISLPNDFQASLMTYNGEVYFHDYQYLTIDQIIETWKMMKGLLESNAFPSHLHDNKKMDNVLEVWWNEKWIPFAKDGGGNLMCIDMDPTVSGHKGQIIYWEKSEGPIPTQYKSFFHWLYAYEQALYRGYYKVDEEGFIYY